MESSSASPGAARLRLRHFHISSSQHVLGMWPVPVCSCSGNGARQTLERGLEKQVVQPTPDPHEVPASRGLQEGGPTYAQVLQSAEGQGLACQAGEES